MSPLLVHDSPLVKIRQQVTTQSSESSINKLENPHLQFCSAVSAVLQKERLSNLVSFTDLKVILVQQCQWIFVTWLHQNLKGKYHENLLSFQNPKMFDCQQKQ